MSAPQVEKLPINQEFLQLPRSLDTMTHLGSAMLIDRDRHFELDTQEVVYADGAPATAELEQQIEYLSFTALEAKYKQNRDLRAEQAKCARVRFTGGAEISGLTGYNAAQPIPDIRHNPETGKPFYVSSVRMERRDDQKDSLVKMFRATTPTSEVWEHIEDEEVIEVRGQDPSWTTIDGQLFMGLVKVVEIPTESANKPKLSYRMVFYKGHSVRNLEFFAYGPVEMKDIRQAQLPTGEIVNFTRPQAPGRPELGGLGQIGEVTTRTIREIKDPNLLQNAELINTRFADDEWGGINYAVALNDNYVGVIGHIARLDKDKLVEAEGEKVHPKIYSSFSGFYNLSTRQLEQVQLQAMADEFVNVAPKTEQLKDVVFGTGITEPDDNGNVVLTLGVGDAETHFKVIKDPFAAMRQPKPALAQAA